MPACCRSCVRVAAGDGGGIPVQRNNTELRGEKGVDEKRRIFKFDSVPWSLSPFFNLTQLKNNIALPYFRTSTLVHISLDGTQHQQLIGGKERILSAAWNIEAPYLEGSGTKLISF